ncbi:MAG: cell division protein, partial [Bryobacteraceae bacterium]
MIRFEEITVISAPIARCFDLARSVEVHLAGNIHCGESAIAAAGVTSGLIGLSEQVTWHAKHFGVWHNLTSEIVALQPPEYFRDRMVRGPFKSMVHDHYFR